LRSRSLAGVVLACSIALFAPLLVPLLTGRVFAYNDLSWFHLPLRFLFQQALHGGDSVLWTPAIFAGLYVHGEGQAGLFHPLHQLLYRAFPLTTAFNLELVTNYPTALAGMFWLLRRLRFSTAAALFGAMLFAFSGFNLLHYHHVNMIAVVAHMPWLLAAADVLIVDHRSRTITLALAAIVMIIGSELLLGFPQAVWWNLLALAAFTLFRAAETGHWRRLVPCAGAVGLGVVIGGVQLLPTIDAAAHSMRAGVGSDFALTYSLHPANLLQLWSPYALARGAHSVGDYMWFHEFGIYSGAVLPLSLAWTWMRRPALPERRALITWATLVAVVALVLALGRYGGLAYLLTYVPGIQSLRAPVRYVVLMQFALAILAAITLDDLLGIADGSTRPPSGSLPLLWVPLALGIATTTALNGRVLPFGRHILASAGDALPGVAVVGVVTTFIYLSARRASWALAAVVIVTAADLGGWGLRFIFKEPPRMLTDLTAAIPPAPVVAGEAYAAAPANGPYKANLLVLAGYRLTTGYVGLFPASQHPLDSKEALTFSGTRWIFNEAGVRRPFEGGVARVRLLDEEGNDGAGTARLFVDRPGRLIIDLDVPAGRVLALTERFHEGWSARVDGEAHPTVVVDEDFLGVAVDSGIHRVVFSFRPRSFVYGAAVSLIGVVLLAGVVVIRLR
jgi:hypothetical protein